MGNTDFGPAEMTYRTQFAVVPLLMNGRGRVHNRPVLRTRLARCGCLRLGAPPQEKPAALRQNATVAEPYEMMSDKT